jgi:hypothetical protein
VSLMLALPLRCWLDDRGSGLPACLPQAFALFLCPHPSLAYRDCGSLPRPVQTIYRRGREAPTPRSCAKASRGPNIGTLEPAGFDHLPESQSFRGPRGRSPAPNIGPLEPPGFRHSHEDARCIHPAIRRHPSTFHPSNGCDAGSRSLCRWRAGGEINERRRGEKNY